MLMAKPAAAAAALRGALAHQCEACLPQDVTRQEVRWGFYHDGITRAGQQAAG
jgi:hypothetical protein